MGRTTNVCVWLMRCSLASTRVGCWRISDLALCSAPSNNRPMSVQLNHTIVPSHDKHESAAFLADLLGLDVGGETGPFVPVQLGNGVTLDYMNSSGFSSQHYAFLVDDDLFESAHQRMRDLGIQTWADPD